jgi:hypothetical protein
MTPEFEQAAKDYGLWNEIVYADPKLEEARELRARKAELKHLKGKRRARAIASSVDGATAIFLLPFVLSYRITKLIFVLPFKLIWWLFAAFRAQKKQIMRFSELKRGKTIATRSLPEIVQAEEIIQESLETIRTHILAALNYDGEAFEVTRAA